MTKRPIGLLDSGVGGLTVLKAVKDRLPNESLIYIGDTKRCPYGNRSNEEVITYTLELVRFLLEKDVKMIVIACNTATAQALEIVKEKVSIPVIGVVGPGSEAAVKATTTGKIGVLATVSTVASKFYEQTLLKHDESLTVKSLPCPTFVDIVEANMYKTSEARNSVEKQLKFFRTADMDTVILGCTHFPLLSPFIQDAVGKDVQLIDSGMLTSYEVERVLKEHNLENETYRKGSIQIFTTGSEKMFRTIAENWLQTKQLEVQTVSLERLNGLDD